jgi:hypothetical protein
MRSIDEMEYFLETLLHLKAWRPEFYNDYVMKVHAFHLETILKYSSVGCNQRYSELLVFQ